MSNSQSPQRLAKYEPRYVPQSVTAPLTNDYRTVADQTSSGVAVSSRSETPSPQRLARFDCRYVPQPVTAEEPVVAAQITSPPRQKSTTPSPQRLARFDPRYVPQSRAGDEADMLRETDLPCASSLVSGSLKLNNQKSSPSPKRLFRAESPYETEDARCSQGGYSSQISDSVKFIPKPFSSEPNPYS